MKRYTITDINNSYYLRLPKFLFTGAYQTLSNDARVLYALVLERFDLSQKNGWINKKGEVFLIFTNKSMANMLGRSQRTVNKVVAELEAGDLIDIESIQGEPNRIYLKHEQIEPDKPSKKFEQTEFTPRNICKGTPAEFAPPPPQNLHPNQSNYNQTNNNQSIYQDSIETKDGLIDEILEKTKLIEIKNDQLFFITDQTERDFYPTVIAAIQNLILKPDQTDRPAGVVLSLLKNLTYFDCYQVFVNFIDVTKKTKIKNTTKYIKTMLLNQAASSSADSVQNQSQLGLID